jgi:hypothetical protein
MDKGTANMDSINKNMKKEMVDFVSFYRRFNNVAGKQSFSTLYTAVNGKISFLRQVNCFVPSQLIPQPQFWRATTHRTERSFRFPRSAASACIRSMQKLRSTSRSSAK